MQSTTRRKIHRKAILLRFALQALLLEETSYTEIKNYYLVMILQAESRTRVSCF